MSMKLIDFVMNKKNDNNNNDDTRTRKKNPLKDIKPSIHIQNI